MFDGPSGGCYTPKVEAYNCIRCGAVFRTENEADNCNQCAIAFCPKWGLNVRKTFCDECGTKRATGTGSYMAPVEGKDPKEPGGMQKVVYSGTRCEHREEFLKNLGKKKDNEEVPEDVQNILKAMAEERTRVEESIPSPEEAKKMVKEGKGIIGDPHSQT